MTTDISLAQQLSQVAGGQYFTIYFNAGLPGTGGAGIVGWRHIYQNASATVNVNDVLPLAATADSPSVPYSSANFVVLSAAVAAEEVGHLFGLRHTDAFGPIGTGSYSNFAQTGVTTDFYSIFNDPTNLNFPTPVESTAPVDTAYDIMQVPEFLDTPVSNLLVGPISFGERDDVKLAFDDTGTVVNEQPTAYQSPYGQAFGHCRP